MDGWGRNIGRGRRCCAGKKLEEGWTVEYTETKRDDRIDMDPYYYAPEVPSFVHILLLLHNAIPSTCSENMGSTGRGAMAVAKLCSSKSTHGPASQLQHQLCLMTAVWREGASDYAVDTSAPDQAGHLTGVLIPCRDLCRT